MSKDKDLTFTTPDSTGQRPDLSLIGQQLEHQGNGKVYQVFGVCWLGATDEWGYIHAEMREDGFPGVSIVRPLSHLTGQMSNGEQRYVAIQRYE